MDHPTERKFGDDLAPAFALVVEGTELKTDITHWVRSLEYESTVDMADMLKIEILNPNLAFSEGVVTPPPTGVSPDLAPPDFISHKALQPGNAIDLYLGYGRADTFIGRTLIVKHLPVFPSRGMPLLTVTAYDKTHLMMKTEGNLTGTQLNRPKFAGDTPYDAASGADRPPDNKDPHETGKAYPNMLPHHIVEEIAKKWRCLPDIVKPAATQAVAEDVGIMQPRGMSDWELVKTLANLNNYETWVDYSPSDQQWILHWRPPDNKKSPQCVFRYGQDGIGSLLDVKMEYGIQDAITEIAVIAWDEKRHTWVSIAYIETPFGVDPIYRKGGGLSERVERSTGRPKSPADAACRGESPVGEQVGAADHIINENIKSATKFRFMAGGVAVDVVTGKPFKSMEEAALFAQRWFDARKNHFIVAEGATVGLETLSKRQVHSIEGIGARLSGEYYFTTVRHKWSLGGRGIAYTTEFVSNKVLE